MKITQITVSYGATQSLPSYSNVKPQLTLTATIDNGEAFEEVESELWALAKAHVHEQIDVALEASGQAAKYSGEPRYQVLRTYRDYYARHNTEQSPILVAIVPDGTKIDQETYGHRFNSAGYDSSSRGLRLHHAAQVATDVVANEEGAILLDCSDGDLSRIPVLERPVAEEPERTAPEHLEDTLDYTEQHDEDDEGDEGDYDEDEDEEPRDFVAESMARTENK